MLKETKKKVFIALIIVVAIAVILVAYLNFFYAPECQNYECWQKYMSRCSKATFVNEEPEASWRYEVSGASGKQCLVNVELLLAKKGDLGIDNIVGSEMTCTFPLGTSAYAEKDLSKCHGILKEELQTLIINKLHVYLLENLGQIEEGLQQAI
ncbi:MAG TPA: hypothetical protein VI544_00640 [Candidatus Nanoarchaeia archaeon]|nr:hypothetical protein [Candidatus Nanoarchaeia archaeon]